MTAAARHPELEQIAALIDGRLPVAERAEVEAHLADCAGCRELFEESARALEATGGSAPAQGPAVAPAPAAFRPARRFRSRHLRLRLALPLAAALLVALAAPWLLARLRTPPPRVAALADQLPAPAGLMDQLWQRGVYRGAGGEGRLDRRSTLAGVLLLDARLALAAGDRARSRATVERLATLLGEVGQLDAQVASLRAVAAALAGGRPPSELVSELDTLEPVLEERLLPGWLDLGRWVEAGRLAAAVRSPAFFRSGATRVRLDRLRKPEAGLESETVAALEPLAVFCDSPPAAEPEWAALTSRLDDLLIRSTP